MTDIKRINKKLKITFRIKLAIAYSIFLISLRILNLFKRDLNKYITTFVILVLMYGLAMFILVKMHNKDSNYVREIQRLMEYTLFINSILMVQYEDMYKFYSNVDHIDSIKDFKILKKNRKIEVSITTNNNYLMYLLTEGKRIEQDLNGLITSMGNIFLNYKIIYSVVHEGAKENAE